jgi:hypothetical protein
MFNNSFTEFDKWFSMIKIVPYGTELNNSKIIIKNYRFKKNKSIKIEICEYRNLLDNQ